MALEYIIEKDGMFYNSHNDEIFQASSTTRKARIEKENGITVVKYDEYPVLIGDKSLSRYERKHGVRFFRYPVSDNEFYEYDTITSSDFGRNAGNDAGNDSVILVVYKGRYHGLIDGTYRGYIVWIPVYFALAAPGKKLREVGQHDIEYWFDFFTTDYKNERACYSNVSKFEHRPGSMQRVRSAFPCDLSENALLFFYMFSKTRKYKVVRYPAEWFAGIPYPKVNRRIGKKYDSIKHGGEIIHFAWQHEVMIHDIPFLDVIVLSGYVIDGVIDVQAKHRFFLTEDFAYSPDGGDFGVFAERYFFGKVAATQLRKHASRLMLDQYSGQNTYKYIFCKHFVPAFEILAKAGCSEIADALLERYYSDYEEEDCSKWLVNYYGQNAEEILRFKLKYLKQLPADIIRHYTDPKGLKILFMIIRTVARINPSLFRSITDVNLFRFAGLDSNPVNLYEKIEYLKRIGTEYYSLYLDYLRLCYRHRRYANGQGAYPSNLRLAHDTMVAYTEEAASAKDDAAFAAVVSKADYTDKIYIPDHGKYCILAPRTAGDLVNESYALSHCVRGYIHAVSTGRTSIYFLRFKDRKSTPLVTIEVRHGYITQARGKCNRLINKEELELLQEWAREKKLDSSRLNA